MTNPAETSISVPAAIIQDVLDYGMNPSTAAQLRSLLPKSTPRLVAVDLEDIYQHRTILWSEKPDLLTLLDEAVGDDGYVHASDVKRRIRAALGVTE